MKILGHAGTIALPKKKNGYRMGVLFFWTLSRQKFENLNFILIRQVSLVNTSSIPSTATFRNTNYLKIHPSLPLVLNSGLFRALNYQESNSLTSVEAENFASHVLDSVEYWYVIHECNAGPTAQDRERNQADQSKVPTISRSIALVLPKSRLAEIVAFHFFLSFCFTCDHPSSYQRCRDGT
ncbi:MAG TPA: hypothetical protein DCS60_02415 [Opitutae bacterium]|nr:hypothetical protein [Opitutae bacterium]